MTRRFSWAFGPLVCFLVAAGAVAEEKKELTEQDFRRVALLLGEDPLREHADEMAGLIAVYVSQTPRAAVVLGEEEMKWTKGKYRGVMLAAYLAGNAQSQLSSGVKRNDRYAGLLSLFQVYRHLRGKDKDFRNEALDSLLKMHREDKLVGYLLELEKKKPTKLSPEDEEALRKLHQSGKGSRPAEKEK